MQQVKPKKTKVTDLGYVFKFGKYKGETVEDILVDDPSYIIWIADKRIMDFSTEIYNQALKNDTTDFDLPDYMDWMEEPF